MHEYVSKGKYNTNIMHSYVWKGEENTNICIHMYKEVEFYKQNQLSGNHMQWPDIISLRVPGFQ